MDFGTLIGMVGGVLLLIFSIVIGGGNLVSFLNLPSFLTTCGGLVAALFIAYPAQKVFKIWQVGKKTFKKHTINYMEMISVLVNFSEKARREGLLALEDDIQDANDEFLKKGVQLVVDGTDPDLVRNILMIELDKLGERHAMAREVYEMAGNVAPAFGMIGTLLGLITMLANLTDKASIGSGMALALITTLYGSILSNLLFLPVAKKLEHQSYDEILLREIILEGILAIQSGDNPRIVKDKLVSFLPSIQREKVSKAINL